MYKLIAIYAIFIFMLAIGATGEDNYYYSDGRQISLTPSSEKLVIGFTEDGYGNFSEFQLDYPELQDTTPPSFISVGGRCPHLPQIKGRWLNERYCFMLAH